MNANGRGPYFDGPKHMENRNKFLSEELANYPDEHVAVSMDGTRVLAHGKDLEAVMEAMRAAGLDPFEAVWDHMPPADVDSFL